MAASEVPNYGRATRKLSFSSGSAAVNVLPGVSSGASWISTFVQVSAEWFLERIRGKPYQYWVFGWLCKNERHRAKIEKMIKRALLYQLSYAPTVISI